MIALLLTSSSRASSLIRIIASFDFLSCRTLARQITGQLTLTALGLLARETLPLVLLPQVIRIQREVLRRIRPRRLRPNESQPRPVPQNSARLPMGSPARALQPPLARPS